MSKKAIIVIQLVPEAEITGDKEIRRQIREESDIPFCAKVEKVSVKSYRSERHHAMPSRNEVETNIRIQLKKQCGYSDKTTKAIIDWYTK